jgi:hypothetical protein
LRSQSIRNKGVIGKVLNALGLGLGGSGKSKQKIPIREVFGFYPKMKPASCEAGSVLKRQTRLEDELRTELQNASQVGSADFEEAVAPEIARGARPLAVVEDVESFGPEFEGHAFFDSKVLEQCHVEGGAVGITQGVSA